MKEGKYIYAEPARRLSEGGAIVPDDDGTLSLSQDLTSTDKGASPLHSFLIEQILC